jgi:hypothetical protein
MKKIITVLMALVFVGTLSAQNDFKYRVNALGGINVTKKKTAADNIDSMKVVANALHVYKGATDLTLGTGTATDTTHLSARINLKADTVNQAFTGTITLPSTTSAGDVSATELQYISTLSSNAQTQLNAKLDTSNVSPIASEVQLLASMRSVLSFGTGSGDAADTTGLSTGRIYSPVYWGGNHDFHVDSMIVSMMHGIGLDTIGIEISFSDTLNAVLPTKLNTTNLAVGRVTGVNKALTVGQVDASFNNAVISKHSIVKMKLGSITVGRKPTLVAVTLVGHLQ